MKPISALIAGLLFGFGLAVSGMMNPAKVIGFLDLGGRWDPTLAFVMAGGLLVNLPAYWLSRRRARPLFDERFFLPTLKDIDARLLLGAAAFGIGWGLAGLCPGPALALLGQGGLPIFLFVAAMAAGTALATGFERLRSG